ncbi:MAG: hypothetical protein KA419_17315 [Acidobacteria bacterium]|nr:hypothetical protein [Acidobacteriota bacterium]
MEPTVGIVLMIIGALDFIVMPKVLTWSWNRSGQEVPNRGLILNLLRLSGLTLVVAGVLIRTRVITFG